MKFPPQLSEFFAVRPNIRPRTLQNIFRNPSQFILTFDSVHCEIYPPRPFAIRPNFLSYALRDIHPNPLQFFLTFDSMHCEISSQIICNSTLYTATYLPISFEIILNIQSCTLRHILPYPLQFVLTFDPVHCEIVS
jgi:hypothetical protein